MEFPQSISFTLTNKCNLRCQMCGQWSEEGYIRLKQHPFEKVMDVAVWKKLVDEISAHQIPWLLLRGGEPFLYPQIIELLEYIHSKDIFISIDTNGTMLSRYAEDIARIGKIHLTISVDGPEEIHDQVRGVKGCYQQIKQGIERLIEAENTFGQPISKAICFTISRYSYLGLGQMPAVARSLSIPTITIVPYYYFPAWVGKLYESEMRAYFNCPVYSWRGFHHEDSGVDPERFIEQLRQYMRELDGITNYPYMALDEEQYRTWFSDPVAPVGTDSCPNSARLFDVQPDGRANYCVDFPDYSFGNVKEASISELWNSPAALRFRELRQEKPFSICHRCGSKYMAAV